MAAMHNAQSIQNFLGTIHHIVADVLRSNAQQPIFPLEAGRRLRLCTRNLTRIYGLIGERNEMQALLNDNNVSDSVYYTNLNGITGATYF